MGGVKIDDRGLRNQFDLDGAIWRDSAIEVQGSDNTIKVGAHTSLDGLYIYITSDGNEIIIEERCRIKGRFIQKVFPNNKIYIKSDTSIEGANIVCGEGKKVEIGHDCMFSWGIEIRTTDSHPIYDIGGGRVNSGEDVIIGDHVWVGAQVTLMRGTVIPPGCVVGIRSFVNSAFTEQNAILAGVPAREVRKGIRWDRQLLG